MTAMTAGPGDFTVLDQLIVRALETLRRARAACTGNGTQKDVDLRLRAEEDLDALLDFRHAAIQRPVRGSFPTMPRHPDRLPT